MLDLFEELRTIAATLDAAGIGYALIGGVAVSMYTTPRATKDIDLLISADDLQKFAVALAPIGYRERSAEMNFAGGRILIRRYSKLTPEGDLLIVDVILAGNDQLEKILAARELVDSGEIWIAPLEGLIELKKLRGSPQDLADIAALLGSRS